MTHVVAHRYGRRQYYVHPCTEERSRRRLDGLDRGGGRSPGHRSPAVLAGTSRRHTRGMPRRRVSETEHHVRAVQAGRTMIAQGDRPGYRPRIVPDGSWSRDGLLGDTGMAASPCEARRSSPRCSRFRATASTRTHARRDGRWEGRCREGLGYHSPQPFDDKGSVPFYARLPAVRRQSWRIGVTVLACEPRRHEGE
jgi:hypothetical protein